MVSLIRTMSSKYTVFFRASLIVITEPGLLIFQDMNLDYTYLSQSDTVFTQLKLSGTFTDGAGVYPEVLFNNVSLQPDLVNISEDGVLSLTENIQITETLVSMSLFGRFYQEDPPYPDQFCPEILKSK